MEAERLTSLWRGGDRAAALAAARAAADRSDPLPLAEALLRCARDFDSPESEEAARLAVELREKAWPPGHPRAGYAALPLADLLRDNGRLGDAEALLRRCETLAAANAHADSDALRDVVYTRARLHLAQGRDADAEAALLHAAEVEDAGRHPRRPPFTLPLSELRALYVRQGRDAEAAVIAAREAAMTKRRVVVGDVQYAVVDEGDGPAVLLLHGFPDSSALWRHQIPALVAAGFRVVAPDLRGFGDSDKPQEVEGYRLHLVAGEVTKLLDALELGRVHVVGHDWGAALAWVIAAFFPERVDRLAVLSVGHPAANVPRSIEQRELSWYMLFFQFTGVAEELLQRDDWRLMREWLHGFGDGDRYTADLARPGALTAALNWYRANVHPSRELAPPRPVPPVAAPTLGMWGSRDAYLTEAPMRRSGEFVTGPWRYERFEGAGHWLQLDEPDRVNALLLEHLR